MIGNITVAGSTQELGFICETRYRKIQKYRNMGLEAPRCKVIVVDDWDITYDQDDYICAPILLPDAKSMECLVAGDMNSFHMLYWNKLENDQDVREYIICILAGLMEKGFDYVFYVDGLNNPNLVPIMKELMSYLNAKYGLDFFTVNDISYNPDLLNEMSVDVKFRESNKAIIQQYGYQNPNSPVGNLFTTF